MYSIRQSVHFAFLLLALLPILASISAAADEVASAAEKEAELIAILQSERPESEKALACKNLAIYGSGKAVPELAKLLANEHLSSWARISLEAIPGSEADEALRKASETLDGKLLVGTINTIGVRRDTSAVDLLTTRLKDTDPAVASAAGVALGRVGTSAAATALRNHLDSAEGPVRSAIAEGCVLCAERFLSDGLDREAADLYDVVRKSDVPQQRILEATRGAILARREQGLPLLLEQFQSRDKSLFNIALSTSREFPGREIDQALASEVARVTPERGALIITAMADRPKTVNTAAILKSAKSGPKPVRIAAISALGRVGDTGSVSTLLESAIESDPQISLTARQALADIPGGSIDKDIVARLAKPDPKQYPLLIELIGERRIDAIPVLLKGIESSDKAVRHAALTSLGSTIPPEKLSLLVKQFVAPKYADDSQVAQTALKTACVRMPDREACATELAAALERASLPTKVALLRIVAAVGGKKSLQTINDAARSNEIQLQDIGSDLLGDWMTIDAAPPLLDLARNAPTEKFRIRAMRGYIKIARQFTMSEPERIEMCQRAMEACQRTTEKKLVVEVLKRYPNIETLKLALNATKDPELKVEASQAVIVIAQKIGDKIPDARELLATAEFPKIKLEIVKAGYGDDTTQKDVTEVLQTHASDTPLILLPSASYNEMFGGDPLPGTPKRLKIQYKWNDQSGDVSLPENALILLPQPKEKK